MNSSFADQTSVHMIITGYVKMTIIIENNQTKMYRNDRKRDDFSWVCHWASTEEGRIPSSSKFAKGFCNNHFRFSQIKFCCFATDLPPFVCKLTGRRDACFFLNTRVRIMLTRTFGTCACAFDDFVARVDFVILDFHVDWMLIAKGHSLTVAGKTQMVY